MKVVFAAVYWLINKAEVMRFSHYQQVTYTAVQIIKRRGPTYSFQCFNHKDTRFRLAR